MFIRLTCRNSRSHAASATVRYAAISIIFCLNISLFSFSFSFFILLDCPLLHINGFRFSLFVISSFIVFFMLFSFFLSCRSCPTRIFICFSFVSVFLSPPCFSLHPCLLSFLAFCLLDVRSGSFRASEKLQTRIVGCLVLCLSGVVCRARNNI